MPSLRGGDVVGDAVRPLRGPLAAFVVGAVRYVGVEADMSMDGKSGGDPIRNQLAAIASRSRAALRECGSSDASPEPERVERLRAILRSIGSIVETAISGDDRRLQAKALSSLDASQRNDSPLEQAVKDLNETTIDFNHLHDAAEQARDLLTRALEWNRFDASPETCNKGTSGCIRHHEGPRSDCAAPGRNDAKNVEESAANQGSSELLSETAEDNRSPAQEVAAEIARHVKSLADDRDRWKALAEERSSKASHPPDDVFEVRGGPDAEMSVEVDDILRLKVLGESLRSEGSTSLLHFLDDGTPVEIAIGAAADRLPLLDENAHLAAFLDDLRKDARAVVNAAPVSKAKLREALIELRDNLDALDRMPKASPDPTDYEALREEALSNPVVREAYDANKRAREYREAHEHYHRQMSKRYPESWEPSWDELDEDERDCWKAGFEEYERQRAGRPDAHTDVREPAEALVRALWHEPLDGTAKHHVLKLFHALGMHDNDAETWKTDAQRKKGYVPWKATHEGAAGFECEHEGQKAYLTFDADGGFDLYIPPRNRRESPQRGGGK